MQEIESITCRKSERELSPAMKQGVEDGQRQYPMGRMYVLVLI